MKLTSCRSCKAPIIWVKTPTGSWMPLDCDPVDPDELHAAGVYWEILDEDANPYEVRRVTAMEVMMSVVPIEVYEAHFATCPEADEHRRPN